MRNEKIDVTNVKTLEFIKDGLIVPVCETIEDALNYFSEDVIIELVNRRIREDSRARFYRHTSEG